MIAALFQTLSAVGLLGFAVGLVLFADRFPPLGEGGVDRVALFILIGATLVASLLHLVACVVSHRRPPRLALVLGVAAAARLILLFGTPAPVLEGDPARTRFDARLVNRGLNPYEFTPEQLGAGTLPDDLPTTTSAYRFDRARGVLRNEGDMPRPGDVRRPELRTTASPLSLWIASIADRFKPESTRGYAFAVLVADVIALFFLVLALRAMGLPPGWLLVYAWSPVLVRELYVTLSVDAFLMPALAFFVYCIASRRRLVTSVGLAIAAGIRPVMLLLVPGALRRIGVLGLLLVVILVALPYLPFQHHGVPAESYVQGTVHTWRHYEYNSLLENLLRGALKSLPNRAEKSLTVAGVEIVSPGEPLNVLLAKILCGIVLLGVVTFTTLRLASRDESPAAETDRRLGDLLFVLVAMLVCSPVLHPSHAIWLLPVLVVRPFGISWLALPGLVSISYVTHLAGPFEADLWVLGGNFSFRVFEFGAFGLLLVVDLLWTRRHFGRESVTPSLRREAFGAMESIDLESPEYAPAGGARRGF